MMDKNVFGNCVDDCPPEQQHIQMVRCVAMVNVFV